MTWSIDALGGPVLAWEMKRATRRRLLKILLGGYCAWLVLQAVLIFGAAPYAAWQLQHDPQLRMMMFGTIIAQQIEFLGRYYEILLQYQLVIVLALVPALTAGSLGQEKERGTLFALFGTELTSPQILMGKLLGRLILIVPLVLTTLPVLLFLTGLTGRGLTPLLLALVQEAILAFAVGAASILFGIWMRSAADAVLASYFFLGLGYFLVHGALAAQPEAFWLDPLENLRRLLSDGFDWEFLGHLAAWGCLALLCLRLGWGRLRCVCVEQRDRRPPRRLWAFRPAVGNNPIRWRECHVIGLAPLPILRIVPRWLALIAVFVFSAVVAVLLADNVAPGVAPALARVDVAAAVASVSSRGRDVERYAVPMMGLCFILLNNLLVGVRCGTSVAEEKRRNTWDDLLLTAQSFREITRGKMWGVLQATIPYIVAYAVPVFILAAAAGGSTLVTACLWILVPCAIVFGAALLGIDMVTVPHDMDETRAGGAFWFEGQAAETRSRRRERLRGRAV